MLQQAVYHYLYLYSLNILILFILYKALSIIIIDDNNNIDYFLSFLKFELLYYFIIIYLGFHFYDPAEQYISEAVLRDKAKD